MSTHDSKAVLLRAACLAVAFVAFYAVLSMRIPISSEVRYIESAWEMVESGDWTVPHLAFVPYLEKPILVYWTSALSRLLDADSMIAVRLTSILASTASVVITFFFALRLGNLASATRAALVVGGSVFFAMFGSVLTTDPLFACWLWAAWFFYWESLRQRRGVFQWVFWACVALGFMTKGPLAIVLVFGSIGLFHLVDTQIDRGASTLWQAWRQRIVRATVTTWRETRPGVGLLVVLAVNLPWTILVYQRDPRLLEFFYVRENFRAFFEGSIHHRQPFWFYATVIAKALAPWTLPALVGLFTNVHAQVVSAVNGGREEPQRMPSDRARRYLVCIVTFNLVFLQISSAKLDTYLLPIVPALSVLVVDAWTRADFRRSKWMRYGLLANAGLLALAFIAALWHERAVVQRTLDTLDPGTRGWAVAIIAVTIVGLLSGGVIAVWRFWRGLALTGGVVAAALIGVTFILPELPLALNASRLAHIVASRERPDDLVLASSEFAQDYTIQLELRHRVGFVGRTRELGMGHFIQVSPPPARLPDSPYDVSGENMPEHPWLFSQAHLLGAWRSQRRVWLFCKQDLVDTLAKAGVELHAIDSEGQMLLYSNRE